VKDAEQIYALYVQANPVPNHDLLPLARDEAVLLSIEGSEAMETQQPTKEQPAARNTSRNVLVAVGAFAVVIVIGLVAALLINSGDSGPVAAADAAPVVAFDGATCSYDGPTQIEEGTVVITTTNSADIPYALYGFLLSGDALAEELQRVPVGTDMDLTNAAAMPPGEMALGWSTVPGVPQTMPWPFSTGTYLLDCVTDLHVWRSAQIEVVAP
jgi:hypothetical protein